MRTTAIPFGESLSPAEQREAVERLNSKMELSPDKPQYVGLGPEAIMDMVIRDTLSGEPLAERPRRLGLGNRQVDCTFQYMYPHGFGARKVYVDHGKGKPCAVAFGKRLRLERK